MSSSKPRTTPVNERYRQSAHRKEHQVFRQAFLSRQEAGILLHFRQNGLDGQNLVNLRGCKDELCLATDHDREKNISISG